MACCNQVKISKDNKELVNTIKLKTQRGTQQINTSPATRSNRAPAGTLIKECSICRCKSIAIFCPVCGNKVS